MQLNHLVIRELVKEAEDSDVHISAKGGPIDVHSAMANQLFDALLAAFNRRAALTHGSFNEENEEGYPFIAAFERFVKSGNSAQDFGALTECGMAQLAAALGSPSARSATGGYVIFASYSSDRHDFLLVALVRDKTSIALDENLLPTAVMEVNLEQLHQAARINVSTFRTGKDSYLSFIGSKQKGDVTHYFATAFGCTDVTPSRKSTGELIRAARDFCNYHDLAEKKEQLVEDVVSYMERQRAEQQSANLGDIERLFDAYIPPEQAETVAGTFGAFANQGPYNVSHEFKPHTGTINRFAKVKAKADNWQLDFTRRSLGHLDSGCDIEFDPEQKVLLLRRLPSKVIEQLRDALEQRE